MITLFNQVFDGAQKIVLMFVVTAASALMVGVILSDEARNAKDILMLANTRVEMAYIQDGIIPQTKNKYIKLLNVPSARRIEHLFAEDQLNDAQVTSMFGGAQPVLYKSRKDSTFRLLRQTAWNERIADRHTACDTKSFSMEPHSAMIFDSTAGVICAND